MGLVIGTGGKRHGTGGGSSAQRQLVKIASFRATRQSSVTFQLDEPLKTLPYMVFITQDNLSNDAFGVSYLMAINSVYGAPIFCERGQKIYEFTICGGSLNYGMDQSDGISQVSGNISTDLTSITVKSGSSGYLDGSYSVWMIGRPWSEEDI